MYGSSAGLVLLFVFLWRPPGELTSSVLLFILATAVCIAVSVWAISIDAWAGGFIALAFLSFLFLGGKIHTAIYWLCISVWFVYVSGIKNPDKLKNYICYALIFHCGLIFIQTRWGLPWVVNMKTHLPSHEPYGVMYNVDASSALIAACICAMFRKKWAYLLPIPLYTLFTVTAFVGVAATAVAVVYYAFRKFDKRYVLGACGLCLAGGAIQFFFIDKPDLSVRMYLWKCILEQHWMHMFLGTGLGNLTVDVPKFGVIERMAHNEFLHFWVELGILAPILMIGGAWNRLKRIRPDTGAALVACIVSAMAYFVMHDPIIAIVAVSWAAISKREQIC